MLKAEDVKAVDIDPKVLESLTTIDGVLEKMKERNLSPIDPPDAGVPIMPEDLGELSNRDLGGLYSRLLAYQNFVASELAMAQALKMQTKNKLSYVKAKLKKDISKKEDIDLHPVLLEAIKENQEAEQRFLMVEAASKTYSKNLAAVSRNIELRKLNFEENAREGNMDRSYISKMRKTEDGKRKGESPWTERE